MLKNEPFFWQSPQHSNHACLLLHGLGGGVYEMQLLGQELRQQGLTVMGINYPGHDRPPTGNAPGKTPGKIQCRMPKSRWQEWYQAVLEAYEKLAQQYPTISVVGFSTGCPLALHLAHSHAVRRLVLLSPYFALRRQWYYGLKPEAYLFSVGRWIDDVPRLKLPVRDRAMRIAAEKAAFFQSFNIPAVHSANELIDLVKPEVPQITVPVLIIQSPQDTVVDPPGAEWVYQTIGSPQKQLIWLKESDHIITLDIEREQVFAAVRTFLLEPILG